MLYIIFVGHAPPVEPDWGFSKLLYIDNCHSIPTDRVVDGLGEVVRV